MSFLERVDQSIRRSALWRSLFRNPYPRDERSRAYAVMNNVFLHIHPVRVRQHAVKFAREEANNLEITDQRVGDAVFGYLFR